MYGESCKYGEQIARLLDIVPRERVLFVTLDEMQADPASVYRSALAHIGIADDGRRDFPVSNPAKTRRSQALAVLLQMLTVAKNRFQLTSGTGLGAKLNRLNARVTERQEIGAEAEQMLLQYFRDDIELCATLIGKNLDAGLSRKRTAYVRNSRIPLTLAAFADR